MKRILVILVLIGLVVVTITTMMSTENFDVGATSEGCRFKTVPTSERCYLHEHQNCNYEMRPGDPGKYRQCTNNNLDAPNDMKCSECGNRGFDLCPMEHRISEKCHSGII